MSVPGENKTPVCEQCGAPLTSPAGEEGCLNCLLTAGMAIDESEAELSPNASETRFYQHYEILIRPDGGRWELGRGAMGVTYKARDVNLDTPVALKIINARFSARPDARRRFLHEAQAAARLRHPNVASVFHFGTINALPDSFGSASTPEENADAGDCFYAMEFIEGETLAARLRRDGPLEPVVTLEIGLQVARALAAAEKRGLVHRDLKPSNIMLASEEGALASNSPCHPDGDAWVKVIDFGLAKFAQEEKDGSARGHFLGTLAFSSPEQIQAHAVDGRADIYSLGATLWYALTGKVPFPHKEHKEANSSETNLPLRVDQLRERRVPEPVIALLCSMLSPDPEARPRSAVELGQALRCCLDTAKGVGRPAMAPSARGVARWALAGGVALAASLVGVAVFLTSASRPANEKSIAVLPFRNLSSDPADAFLAQGVQDDILSRLVKIRELKVISGMATARYAANAPHDLHEIGRTLGVRHVLEGSLRRSGDHVHLHVVLIDTVDGHEVWAEGYDRKLADAINLQGELASDIALALDAKLSPQESRGVRASSTKNPDAYVLYLRGRNFETSLTFLISNFEAAEALYRQAITLDPGFALAHARLASVLSLLYRYRGPSEELRDSAYAEVRKALQLQPDLGEAHLVLGLCAYRIERDFNRALPELEKAKVFLPNDVEGQSFIAYIQRRRGQWREARAGLERCLSRDPGNVIYQEELYTTAYLLRDWPAAQRNAGRAEVLAPTNPILKFESALVPVWKDGNLAPLEKVFAGLPSYGDTSGILTWHRWDAAMMARDFTAAQAAIDRFPFATLSSVYSAPVPKSYLQGCIALATGDNARAQQEFEAARPGYEAECLAHPDDSLRHARLGLLYAYLGRKADAIREGKRAVELEPVAEDAFDGPEELSNLALIYARVGDSGQAISMIESLLRMPGGVFFYEASMSLWELRLRWQWDPLRKDPRFQKILAGPEPPTVF